MERRVGVFGIIVGVALLAGCTTTPVERQEATQESLANLRNAMASTQGQIEETLASLINLMHAPPEDLGQAYQEYARNADAIAREAERIEAESRRVDQHSNNWLSNWEQSRMNIDDPELRALTEKRRELVLSRFENVEGSLIAAREAFEPFVQSLQDIKRVVGNDLSPGGVAAVSGTEVVQSATANGAAASRALEVTIAESEALMELLSPTS